MRQLRRVLYRAELGVIWRVCPKCDHHMRMSARARLHTLLDEGSEVELGSDLEPKDVLKFKDSKRYKDRLVAARKRPAKRCAGGDEGARCTACRSSRRPLNSPSSAVRCLPWLARVSCVRLSRRWRTTVRWCASPPAAARAHAGGADVADADGENQRGVGQNAGARLAVHLRADRPDHGRRLRQRRCWATSTSPSRKR